MGTSRSPQLCVHQILQNSEVKVCHEISNWQTLGALSEKQRNIIEQTSRNDQEPDLNRLSGKLQPCQCVMIRLVVFDRSGNSITVESIRGALAKRAPDAGSDDTVL